MRSVVVIFICIIFLSCHKHRKDADTHQHNKNAREIKLKYAEGFKINIFEGAKLVEIIYPFQGALSGHKYLLVQRGATIPEHDPETKVITIPLKNIACTSTTHIPFLDYLGETDKLIGFTSTDYISSEKMRKRIDRGEVTELGSEKGINLEKLAMLKPDLIMGYTVSSDYGQFKKIEELGIPVVINAEYLEKHPLGRAEWIKFMALFFNKENEADSIFQTIEKNYQEIKTLAQKSGTRPTVLTGVIYGDAWFLPGGQNYSARILKDAGCKYLWEEDSSNGFLQLNFETVYEKAHQVDLWIGVGSFSSLEEIKNADERYAKFKAFTTKQVYTYNARIGPTGGSEYMELGYLRPDIILKDLVKIAQPNILPDYKLYFHKKLQ